MAPEQAAGHVHDIGPACDVYALGAILYECLTGRPPFNAATQFLTLQQVQWLPPVAPSGFQPAVPRDVETVCLKCLEKEPHRRYASAQELADDLDRFLTGRPIQARPAGWLEHAWKWTRRRPAVAALLGTLAAAVLVVIGVLLWSVVRVSHEAQRAREQAEYAQNAVDDMYSDVAMDWLAEDPDKNFLQRKFLGRALGYYKRLAAEDAAEPAARRRTARAHFRMGELNRMLNEPAEALAEYQEAIDRQLRLRDEFPGDPDYREDLAESYNWRGEVLRETSKSLAEAERDFRAALELQDQLAREAPGEPRYRRALARSYSNLALVEMDTARRPQAQDDYDEAVRLLDGLVKDHEQDTTFRHELARTLTNRGVFHLEDDRLPQAEEDFARAIDLLEKLRRTGTARTTYAYNLAIVYQDMGNLRFKQQRYADALVPLRRAETILARLTEDFHDRARYRKKLAKTYNSLGSALAKDKQLDQAEANWKKARDLLTELLGDGSEEMEYRADLGRCLGNLGWLKLRQEDLPAARSLLEGAVGYLRAAHESSPGRLDYQQALRSQYQTLAETLVQSGQRKEAVDAAAALAETSGDWAKGHYLAACFVARCVRLAEKEGQAADAERCADQAATLLRQALDRELTGKERLAEEEELLRPLAERPAYATLLNELRARSRPAPGAGGR
jgi:tetratricopeptide (TPR) repeat protein